MDVFLGHVGFGPLLQGLNVEAFVFQDIIIACHLVPGVLGVDCFLHTHPGGEP